MTLEEMTAQRDALLAARYRGLRTVEIDGHRVTYRRTDPDQRRGGAGGQPFTQMIRATNPFRTIGPAMFRSLIAGLFMIAGGVSAIGQPAGTSDAERGRKVTEKWCRLCHAVAGSRKPTAPAFSAIVRRPGRDDDYLRNFLEDDHFPMTMYRLFPQEKEDVLAYFRSLRVRR